MKPFNIDPLEAAVFACGFVLAIMLVRTLKMRQASHSQRRVTAATKAWMSAAVALAALFALWLFLS